MRGPGSHGYQRGMVLVMVLLVLLVMGVIAGTVARTNQLQLRMAGNDESRIAAMQQALAVVDSLLLDAVRELVPGPVGYRVCSAQSVDEACDERTIALDPEVEPAAGDLEVALVRVAPLWGRLPVMAETQASSTVRYRVAKFEIRVAYDGMQHHLGRAVLAQGVLVRLPVSLQPDGGSP